MIRLTPSVISLNGSAKVKHLITCHVTSVKPQKFSVASLWWGGWEVRKLGLSWMNFGYIARSEQGYVNLSSPNLMVCGPRVFFGFFWGCWGDSGSTKWQKCRCSQTHTHLLGKVMTGRRSVGERKNNELMMTHRRHMLARLLTLSRMRARKLIHFLWDQESQQGYSSQKRLLKGRFTQHSLHIRPHSFHSIFQRPSYLVSTDKPSYPHE